MHMLTEDSCSERSVKSIDRKSSGDTTNAMHLFKENQGWQTILISNMIAWKRARTGIGMWLWISEGDLCRKVNRYCIMKGNSNTSRLRGAPSARQQNAMILLPSVLPPPSSVSVLRCPAPLIISGYFPFSPQIHCTLAGIRRVALIAG